MSSQDRTSPESSYSGVEMVLFAQLGQGCPQPCGRTARGVVSGLGWFSAGTAGHGLVFYNTGSYDYSDFLELTEKPLSISRRAGLTTLWNWVRSCPQKHPAQASKISTEDSCSTAPSVRRSLQNLLCSFASVVSRSP